MSDISRNPDTGSDGARAWQTSVIAKVGVSPHFDAQRERERRVQFLADFLAANSLNASVPGISCGLDPSTAVRLAQLAGERMSQAGRQAHSVTGRLPHSAQRTARRRRREARIAIHSPRRNADCRHQCRADAMLASRRQGGAQFTEDFHEEFVMGYIKARRRMIAQYAIACARRGVVIGTEHAADSLMGFFAKFGDGGADILPLAGLNKRRMRALATTLSVDDRQARKIPAADLESLTPRKPGEDSYGIVYDEIDDFLESKPVSAEVRSTIRRFHTATRYKRALPVSFVAAN